MAERVGFEPTVAKDDTRSPGAPDRPLQHLSLQWRRGWDSNPRGLSPTAFRERHHQPLGHLSDNLNELNYNMPIYNGESPRGDSNFCITRR
jgi:hypothetical protein